MDTNSSPPGGAIEKAEVSPPVSVNVARRIKEGRVGYGCSSSSRRVAMTMLNRETGRPSESPPASFCRCPDHTLAPPTRVSTVTPKIALPPLATIPDTFSASSFIVYLFVPQGFSTWSKIPSSTRPRFPSTSHNEDGCAALQAHDVEMEQAIILIGVWGSMARGGKGILGSGTTEHTKSAVGPPHRDTDFLSLKGSNVMSLATNDSQQMSSINH